MQVEERDYLVQMQEEVARLTQPLLDQYNALDAEIKKYEARVSAMRRARTSMRTMIRAINPELIPVNGKKSGKNPGNQVSAKRLASFEQWLREHSEEIDAAGGVYASGLVSAKGKIVWPGYDADLRHQSAISKALATLHDRGVLRLDHLGNGGAKYFKVVR